MVQTTDTENKGKNGLGIWYITLNCDNKNIHIVHLNVKKWIELEP